MSKTPKENNKIDLDLLKKLVNELEVSLNTADQIKADKADVKDYIVELSKAQGLAAGIMKEASLLVLDIQGATSAVQAPVSGQNDLLEKLIGPLKGNGNTN